MKLQEIFILKNVYDFEISQQIVRISNGSFPSSSADLSSFHWHTSRSLDFLLTSLEVEDLTNVHLYVKPQGKKQLQFAGSQWTFICYLQRTLDLNM